jgi:tetratricopeptide (TPR) repeat protein
VKQIPVSTDSLSKPRRIKSSLRRRFLLVLAAGIDLVAGVPLAVGVLLTGGVPLVGGVPPATAASGPEAENLAARLEKADRLDDNDRFLEAIAVLKEAEKSDPQNVEILYRISRVESDLEEDLSDDSKKKTYALESVAYAKRAVDAAPQNSNAYLAAAIAYGDLTDFVDDRTKMEYSKVIKAEAEKAIELDSKNDYAYLVLARWNFEMTDLNPILKGFAEMLYGQMPPASQDKALEDFQKAIALAPNRIIHHYCYGEALARLGRKDQAKAEFQKVLRLTATDKEERGYQQKASSGLKTLER